MKRREALGALAAAVLPSCASLTFSHDGAVDFSRFRVVRVAPVRAFGHGAYAREYLASELAQSSGFSRVTTDDAERADLVLDVEVDVVEEVAVDEEGNTDVTFAATASFVARTPAGAVVDVGRADARSESGLEALEDALDWVAYRYLKPYRA